jgi:hypothetical protein
MDPRHCWKFFFKQLFKFSENFPEFIEQIFIQENLLKLSKNCQTVVFEPQSAFSLCLPVQCDRNSTPD